MSETKNKQVKKIVPAKKEVKQTKDLLTDLNNKINDSKTSDRDKRLTLLITHKKITNKLLEKIPHLFFLFILDLILLLSTTAFFFANMHFNQEWITWTILVLSGIILSKFTYMNWFSKNLYFKKIVVYKFKSKVDRKKFNAYREISFTPIWFLIFFVASNFFVAVMVNYEIQGILLSYGDGAEWGTRAEVLFAWAVARAMLDMMLLPSFLNSFGKIAQSSKKIDNNYVKLIKDQYFSNKSLFEDVEFEDHYLNLKFPKNNLVSKNGLFILINKDDLTRPDQGRMKEINTEILERYKEIWESYVDLLENRMKAKFNKASVHKLYWLERIYDTVFLDLFDI